MIWRLFTHTTTRSTSTVSSTWQQGKNSLLVRGGSGSNSQKNHHHHHPHHQHNHVLFSSGAHHHITKNLLKEQAKNAIPIATEKSSLDQKCFGGLFYRDLLSSSSSTTTTSEASNPKKRVVFVLGGPGAGKGTQSELLLQNYPFVHLSAGELLRRETTKPESPHAALIEQCLVAGKIVPVEISLALLENAMNQAAETSQSLIFLIDGFPRNFDNLEGWTRCMKTVADVCGVLVYQCPLKTLEERILERAKESGRSDDNMESIRKRFRTFETDTVPVIDTLRLVAKDTTLQVFDINGNQSLENVWLDTQRAMNSVIVDEVISANAHLLEAVAKNNVETYQQLVAKELWKDISPEKVIATLEGDDDELKDNNVSCAEVNFITGTKVFLSYERMLGGTRLKEIRIWSHRRPNGWQMIHFSRSPL